MRLTAAILSVLLLAGCASWQPASQGECDCKTALRVPDKAFRNWLLDNGYAERVRGKRLRATPKGCALKNMECYEKGIRSLQGIELFPQLEQLTCSDNPIETLNLDALRHLERLYALNVPLQQLTMDSCHRLRHVQLSHTSLDTIDLAPFPDLDLLLCIFSPLRHLDLTPCSALQMLYIRGTQIRSIDLRPCPAFRELHAQDSPLGDVVITAQQYQSAIKVSAADTIRIDVR